MFVLIAVSWAEIRQAHTLLDAHEAKLLLPLALHSPSLACAYVELEERNRCVACTGRLRVPDCTKGSAGALLHVGSPVV